jgi:hypothetical protein
MNPLRTFCFVALDYLFLNFFLILLAIALATLIYLRRNITYFLGHFPLL